MDTAVYGFSQQRFGFIVSRDKDIHIGVFVLSDYGERMVFHMKHILKMNQSFQKAHDFHDEENDVGAVIIICDIDPSRQVPEPIKLYSGKNRAGDSK